MCKSALKRAAKESGQGIEPGTSCLKLRKPSGAAAKVKEAANRAAYMPVECLICVIIL
jgi:hypothetical protein